MSRRRKTARIVKSAVSEEMETPCEVVSDQLEAPAREGAREMLLTTLVDEADGESAARKLATKVVRDLSVAG